MTARLPYSVMRRPRRRWGEKLFAVECPLMHCRGEVRVVAYRVNTARLECRRCGLRFSVNGRELDEVLDPILVAAFSDNDGRVDTGGEQERA